MKNLLTAFLFLFSLPALCQNYTISGVVKDSSQTPIPLVSIFTKTGEGTLINDLGEFSLKVSTIPTTLIVSHVSYQSAAINITDEQALSLILKESIKTLPEAKVGNYAFELIKKAMDKANQDSVYSHFSRGFYRRIQKEGNKYTLLHELFFNANINGRWGISEWQPTASRYTLHDGNVENKSIIFYTLNNGAPSPRIQFRFEINNAIPSIDIPKYYHFEIENYIDADTPNEIAVVLCTPRQPLEMAFSGRFYISTASNTVLRVKGRRGLSKKSWPSSFLFKVKEYYLDMDVNYRVDNGVSVLSGMNLDFVTMVQYASSVNRKVVDHVSLIMYDNGEPENGEELKMSEQLPSEDVIFGTTQASPEFWENNAIIKRTPVEDGIIKVFEGRKKKGGNMFPKK